MPTRRPASWAVVLITVAVLAACDAGPVVTGPPAVGNPTPAPSAGSPGPSEAPFSRASWPASGSACGTEGYTGNLGRIEATEARTVVFTLCAPDGAFLSRVAHPALGILDAATIAELATNPDSARSLAGTGPYRIDHWTPGRTSGSSGPATRPRPTPGSRRSSSPGPTTRRQRTIGLQSATVDGIDAPGPADLDRIATLPELAVYPRDGLATAYLGFGTGAGLGKVAVRRALAGALDRDGAGRRRVRRRLDRRRPTSRRASRRRLRRHGLVRLQRAGGERGARRRPSSTWGRRTRSTSPTGRVPGLPDPAGARQGRRRAARDEHRAAHRDRHDARPRLSRPISRPASSTGCTSAGSPRRSRTPGGYLEPAVRRGRAHDRAPTGRRRPRPRSRTRPPTPDPAARATRSAAPTTPSATPRPSSRWPTRARTPRSVPT